MDRCREIIAEGGCDHLDPSYVGPSLPIITSATKDSQPKYGINKQFVEGMLIWFKEGKVLPKRFVWEIVLNTYDILIKEESLTDMPLGDGVICDVIGDTHGAFESHVFLVRSMLNIFQDNSMIYCICLS